MNQTVLLYTENHARGGGNKYFTDIANIIPLNYELIIVSNPNGIFKHDFDRLTRNYIYESVKIRHSHNDIYNKKKILHYITMAINLIIDKVNNKYLFNKLLLKYAPMIVISANGGYPAALSCLQLIEITVKKNIYTILTVVSMPHIRSGLVERLLYTSALVKVNCIVVNSKTIKKAFVDTRRISPDKIFVIYNCIDVHYTKKKRISDYLTIGYIGRIESAKGVFYLIDAFNRLYKEILNIKLLLVGDGNIEKVKEKIYEYGIENYVTFTGFYEGKIEDMLDVMDIFVFPSLWEGFPYSILEAMSTEKVIVSTNVGGIPEVIEDGINGFLVSPADSDQIYNTMKKIALNYSDYIIIGKKAHDTVRQKFSPEVFKKEFNQILEKGSLI
jgi:glycosyltransferase involved in cell wall biosynthesis